MSRKHFSWLLFATFVVAGLVLLVPGKTGRESSLEQTVFLPELAAKVNDIQWLRLKSAGDETVATLERDEAGWVMQEASGYPVDWGILKSLLSGLSQAEIIETKTTNPVYYPRLGVEDVSLPEATGVMVEFSADSGLPAVIIGNRAQGRTGQYARPLKSAESVLINTSLNIPVSRTSWLVKEIVDISDTEVVEFEILHPDGESIKAMKASADDENFQLQDIPVGREIKSDWSVNSIANALADLSLDAVTPADGFDWNSAVRFNLLTADGLLLDVELLLNEENESWIRLGAAVYTTAIRTDIDVSDESAVTSERASEINSRVSGWAYRIPVRVYELINKRREDLLQAVENS